MPSSPCCSARGPVCPTPAVACDRWCRHSHMAAAGSPCGQPCACQVRAPFHRGGASSDSIGWPSRRHQHSAHQVVHDGNSMEAHHMQVHRSMFSSADSWSCCSPPCPLMSASRQPPLQAQSALTGPAARQQLSQCWLRWFLAHLQPGLRALQSQPLRCFHPAQC